MKDITNDLAPFVRATDLQQPAPDKTDRAMGYVLNALAGIGFVAGVIAVGFYLGYKGIL